MKVLKWISDNLLFVFTLFLLAFIPLYPKLPLINVVHTWVYVRAEDFVLVAVVIIWITMLLLKKVSLKTPLTIPILIFWIVGGISTLHGVLLIFPTISDVFSNVALLSFLRRIEYMFLFFVAFTSIKDKKFLSYTIYALATILILISLYGFGQKFLGFPAYLTMNEEFAKGIPIYLSDLSRVPSTFAGQYDLAAYLVLVIPILVSVLFCFKNWLIKILLGFSAILGFALLFMTVSRVSFIVLILSLVILLLLQKKKLLLLSLLVVTILFLGFFPSLALRFSNSLKEVTIIVDAKTGAAIGQIKEVNKEYFKNKIVRRQYVSADQIKLASTSAVLPFELIPANPVLLLEANVPTGETLPQGTGYINLPLSPVLRRESEFFFEKAGNSTTQSEALVYYGDYVVKKTFAYDLSFTTRFQGEWPKTFQAFTRNIFIGSGYGSVTLAVDNDFLRILGESGLFGLFAFLSIFIIAAIYIRKILPKVDSPLVKGFTLGFMAGTFGLMLNAIFIDVFEASKVAFTFWLLMGITLGILNLYKNWDIDIPKEFIKIITSPFAIITYILILTFALYSSMSSYYFVGDDFTWFRWVADCHRGITSTDLCHPSFITLAKNFIQSDGFFYRPGTKIYFSLMYSVFWLNQNVYHLTSIFLQFAVAALVFLISRKILKNYLLAVLSAVIFAILSGYNEAVFWISSTGFLFNAVFALSALLSFVCWREKGKKIYLIISFISIVLGLLFHEMGVVAPLILIAYDLVFTQQNLWNRKIYLSLCFPILPYLILRYISNSHWLSGDYNYNLLKLPYNFLGNAIGYAGLDLLGPLFLPVYNALRAFSRHNIPISIFASVILIILFILAVKFIIKKVSNDEKRVIIFACLFFAIFLLPFLGLGNITSRYSYLSSFGIVLLLVIFVKKIYFYLLDSGRNIAVLGITLIIIIFFSLQLFQLQKIHKDWRDAGEKTKNFLVSLNEVYTDDTRGKSMQFYFVDVPIRQGEAWVFPVGLNDALWFTFRNDQLLIDTKTSLKPALEQALVNPNVRVFQFSEDGRVEKVDPNYLKEIKK